MGLKSEITGRVKAAANALLGRQSLGRGDAPDDRTGGVAEHERVRDKRAQAEKAEADARFEERRAEREQESAAARRRARGGR